MGSWKQTTDMRGLSLACIVLVAGLVVSEETTESSAKEEITLAPIATPSVAPVVIIKQVNEINEDGTYTVGYEASDGSFKLETKDAEGNVEGKYGFVDQNGDIKIVEYSANNSTGFSSDVEIPSVELPSGAPSAQAPAPIDPGFAPEQQRHATVIAHQKAVVERQEQIARQRNDAAQRQAFANQRGQAPRRPVFNAANFNPSRPASEQFNTQNFNQDFRQFQQQQQFSQQPQQQQQFFQQPQQQFAEQPRQQFPPQTQQQFAQQPRQQFAQQPNQFQSQFTQNQQFAQNPQQFSAQQQQQQFAPQQPALTPLDQLTQEQIALEGFSRDEDQDGQVDPLPSHLQRVAPQQPQPAFQRIAQQPLQPSFQQRQPSFQNQAPGPQFRAPQPVAPSPAGHASQSPQLSRAQLNQLFSQAQQQQQAPQRQFAPQQQQQFASQQQFAPQQQQQFTPQKQFSPQQQFSR